MALIFNRRATHIAVTALVATLATNAAQAQTIPDAARPSAVERQLRIEKPRPNVGGAAVISTPDAVAKKIGDGTQFTLTRIVIEGETVYGEAELAPLYADKLASKVTLDDLNQIAADITNYYRNHGYILTRAVVPPQAAKDGVVTIRVIEGFVNDVRLQGDVKPGSERRLQAYADKIKAAKPLNAKQLERYLLLMEDLPGVEARAVLEPAANTPGATDVVVTITREAVDFLASTDNRGSRFLGRPQANASIYFNNALGLDEQTQLRIANTPFEREELRFGEIRHEQQLGSEGTTLLLSAGTVRTKPGFTLDPLDVNGRSTTYSIGASHPILRSRRANWFINTDFTYRNVDVTVPGLKLYADKTRVATLGTSYDFVDSSAAVNRLETNISQGLNWDVGNNGNPLSRANGETDFTKATARLSRIQPISGPWSLFASAAGQYSFDPLLSSEEFALGGSEFGSAYDSAEITGDSGFGTRAELQYNASEQNAAISQYQIYGFYDIGTVYNRSPIAGSETSSASLASTGLGARLNLFEQVNASVEAAVPLTRDVAANDNSNDPRVFFSLQYRY